jgi:hypothetical protein
MLTLPRCVNPTQVYVNPTQVYVDPAQEPEQPKERHERPTRPPSTFVWKSKAQAEDEEAGYEFDEEEQEEEGFSHDDEEDEAYDGHEQVAADAEYHRREQEVVYNRREHWLSTGTSLFARGWSLNDA